MKGLPKIRPWAMARIGDIKGATSMAPMITAPLSRTRPRVAMVAARTIMT